MEEESWGGKSKSSLPLASLQRIYRPSLRRDAKGWKELKGSILAGGRESEMGVPAQVFRAVLKEA
jgi:hypothetical protein